MRDGLVLLAHLIVTIIRIMAPGGARTVVAESLLLKHQLLILNRSRKKASRLRALDRILLIDEHPLPVAIGGRLVNSLDLKCRDVGERFSTQSIAGRTLGEPRASQSDSGESRPREDRCGYVRTVGSERPTHIGRAPGSIARCDLHLIRGRSRRATLVSRKCHGNTRIHGSTTTA
jgi:hypothetical protein